MTTRTTAGEPAAAARDPAVIALALTLLLGIQPVTTDLYLPALPALTQDLAAPMAAAQLTLSGLIIAFGFGQLLWGPVSDRCGRRPVLLAGLALYVLASVLGALAPTIEMLVLWRVVQGTALAAAVVCGRALVRDLFEPHEGMRVMSKGMSGLGVIALSSPAIGGVVAATLGWRAALLVPGLFAAAALAFIAWRLDETLPQRNPQATRLAPLLATWGRILRHPTFLAYAALTTGTYAGLFTFLAGSSFVFIDVLGTTRIEYGLLMASSSVAYLAGTFWCRRGLRSHGVRGTVARGAVFTLAGGAAMAGLALAGVHGIWAVIVPQWLYAFGHGIHQPCGQAGAVGPFPGNAGAASALSGFLLAVGAFAVGGWLGVAMNGTVYPMVLTLGFWAAVTALVAWTLVQRHGDPSVARAA
ncbi:multidrug effflux MFS transporter [Caldimonas tepidiphila]|uniref:multidrug effflux MFS transporter n=1 Tax=Caldimonas tepidiphila TaxID=2315841 RepID=UPI000E5BA384|nr:multidrug effflux MFS transporter [Caldimonas tepidiphila]